MSNSNNTESWNLALLIAVFVILSCILLGAIGMCVWRWYQKRKRVRAPPASPWPFVGEEPSASDDSYGAVRGIPLDEEGNYMDIEPEADTPPFGPPAESNTDDTDVTYTPLYIE